MEYPAYVAALDIGGTKIAGALLRYEQIDAAPEVVFETQVPTQAQRGGGPVGEKGKNQSGLGAVRVRQQQTGLLHLYGCGQLGGPAAGEKHRQPGPVAPGGLLAPGLGGEQGHAPLPRQPGGGFVRTGFVQKAQGKALPGSRRLQRLHPATAQRPGRFTGQSQRVKALCPGGGYGILGGLSRRGT